MCARRPANNRFGDHDIKLIELAKSYGVISSAVDTG
jgi:hypothetical protein